MFSVAVLSIIFKVQDQKHGRKTEGVMPGIVAAIWHLSLRSNLFMAIYIFMLLVLSLSCLTIAYSNSLLQGH